MTELVCKGEVSTSRLSDPSGSSSNDLYSCRSGLFSLKFGLTESTLYPFDRRCSMAEAKTLFLPGSSRYNNCFANQKFINFLPCYFFHVVRLFKWYVIPDLY